MFERFKTRKFKVNLHGFVVIFAIFGLLFAMYMSIIGFHNVDMAHNMKWLNAKYDLDLVDETLQGTIVDSYEAYRIGWHQIRLSILVFIISALYLGIALSELLNLASEESFNDLLNKVIEGRSHKGYKFEDVNAPKEKKVKKKINK